MLISSDVMQASMGSLKDILEVFADKSDKEIWTNIRIRRRTDKMLKEVALAKEPMWKTVDRIVNEHLVAKKE
jgi:uncharacterized protein YqgV (UPF0045/DUF77 family)